MDTVSIEELDNLLNQQLACNGSSIKITEMDEKKLVVRLEGTCRGCPGAEITIKDTVEAVIKERIPTIEEVILDTAWDEELLAFARQLLNHGK